MGGGLHKWVVKQAPDNPTKESQLSPVGIHGVRHVPHPEDGTERICGGAVDALGQVAGVLRVQDVGAAQPELGESDLVLDENGEVPRALQDPATGPRELVLLCK